ncbi:MAG: hypothetical protein A2583_05750 [Bdellovibrionales bacterium RIFOXYD1_FULL_53_11]|nr:MAG: hypothetical protein A2583_05750 [Bdellovibrionales bacterium RIFOXYD1_FULL_53_11]
MKLSIGWKNGMVFEASMGPHKVLMDAPEASGGKASAATPKQLALAGLGGCTSMDVIYILRKMRVEVTSFALEAEASVTKDMPNVFDKVHLVYRLEGPSMAHEKALAAVEKSQTKYCGVSAMIAKTARITYDVLVNGTKAGSGEAGF